MSYIWVLSSYSPVIMGMQKEGTFGSMLEIYWYCFIGGTIFAVLLVLFDMVLGGWLDGVMDALPDAIQPISLVGGIVAFGGSGILLTEYTGLGTWMVAAYSLLAAVALSMAVFFFYVRPMRQAESSVAYSIAELPGKIGEVTVPIPVGGFGEVQFVLAGGRVHEIASSIEAEELAAGEKVVAVEVKDGIVTVCRLENRA